MIHTWKIGDFRFFAKQDGTGFFYYGTIGHLELLEETFSLHSIERIMDHTAQWVVQYCRRLSEEADNFKPSENL